MGILWNMQLLSSCSRVLTSLRYQDGYYGCRGSHYGRCAMLKLVFVAPKYRLRRVQKYEKKEQKMKNRVLQKTLFYFCVFTSWKWFWGLIRVEKIIWGSVLAKKFFLTFCRQLRCEILEMNEFVPMILS